MSVAIYRGVPLVVIAIAAALVISFGDGAHTDEPPVPDEIASITSDPMRLAEVVEADVEFRRQLGFRSDREFVESLYHDPSPTTGHRLLGALFTPEEAAELEARLKLEQSVEAVREVFDEQPATFGGIHFDHLAGGVMVVSATEWTPNMREEVLKRVGSDERVVFRIVDYPLEELQRVHDRIAAALNGNGDVPLEGLVSVAIDTVANRITLGLDPLAFDRFVSGELSIEIDGVDPAMLSAVEGGEIELQSLGNDPNAPPVYGGHAWDTDWQPGTTWCTIGFEVERSGQNQTSWMITAGHCLQGLPSSSSVDHAGATLGTTQEYNVGGNQDFGLIKGISHSTTGNRVWTGFPTVTRTVVGDILVYSVGSVRCWTGQATNDTKCGTIITETVSGLGFSDRAVHAIPGIGGDSGSPVFSLDASYPYNARANGIYSGIIHHQGVWRGFYAKWHRINGAWGVGIAVN